MRPRSTLLLIVPLAISVFAALAEAQKTIPVRQVSATVSTDSGVLRSLYGVRPLPGDRVMVHDFVRKRVLLFDASLKKYTVVFDTADGSGAMYGTFNPGLVPFTGDSTLIMDRGSNALVLIDPSGKVGRAMSPPKPADLSYMASMLFDRDGIPYYRGYRNPPRSATQGPPPEMNSNVPVITKALVDSAPIVRANFDARSVDTVAMLHIPIARTGWLIMKSPSGATSRFGMFVVDPLPVTDEWTLLPDGTIAIVRTQDYHIDWVGSDGKVTATPKMPFDWKRISSEEKTQIIDSLRNAYESLPENKKVSLALADGKRQLMPFVSVEPSDLPDYYPPVRSGQVKSDADGNIWVLPATSSGAAGGLLFDVVNRKGEVIERVQLPPNRALVALGPGGSVYLSAGEVGLAMTLERAHVMRNPADRQ
jgi:hypothetical protein